jgi:hypothetical protein
MTAPVYVLDPLDPRAPTTEQWEAMSDVERRHVVDQLPSELPRETAAEGERHREATVMVLEALAEGLRCLCRSQSEELIARLDGMVSELVEKEQNLARELEAMTARAEEEKARADRAEAQAARLAAQLEALGIAKD